MGIVPNRHRANKRRRTTYNDSTAVYDGRRYLGVILPHGEDAFHAIDCAGQLVGTFSSRREAAAAIMRGVR